MENRKSVVSFIEFLNLNQKTLQQICNVSDKTWTRYLFLAENENKHVPAKTIRESHEALEAPINAIGKLVHEMGVEFFSNVEVTRNTDITAYRPYGEAKRDLRLAWTKRPKFKKEKHDPKNAAAEGQ